MNMSRWICPLLASAALACVSHTLLADDAPAASDTAALFTQLDADKDGFVVASEAPTEKQALLARLMRSADKNNDGKLSKDEFVAGLKPDAKTDVKSAADDTSEPTKKRPRPDGAKGKPAREGAGLAAMLVGMDKNGDGKLTPDEVPEERRERFTNLLKRLDANGDGALTKDEFPKGPAGQTGDQPDGEKKPGGLRDGARPAAGPVLKSLDTDGDGKLSKDEIAKASASLGALDKDGDGTITPRELGAGPGGPQVGSLGGAKPKGDEAKRPGQNPEAIRQRFKEADKNNDGKLSKDEMPERMAPLFERLDQNNDSQVDSDELRAGLEKMRERAAKQNPGANKPNPNQKKAQKKKMQQRKNQQGKKQSKKAGKKGANKPDGDKKPADATP